MAGEGFGVGPGGFAGEPHDEWKRRQEQDDDREDEEGVFVTEHGGLAEHLLVSLSDGHLGCVSGGHSVRHHHLFHAVHIEAIGDAAGNCVGCEVSLMDLSATGEIRGEESRACAAAEITSEVGE